MEEEARRLPTRIARLDPRSLKLLDRNARFMRHEQFKQLVENVKRDGALSSVPFAWTRPDGTLEVLSGNHRVQAAIDAGLAEIDVMVTDAPLTDEQRLALQLSHNAIAGDDDPTLLAQLYNEIGNLDLKRYSGIDDAQLQQMLKVSPASISEFNLEFRTLMFMFLPHEVEDLERIFKQAVEMSPRGDGIVLAEFREFDRLLDAFAKVEKRCKIQNRATALRVILDVFEQAVDQFLPVEDKEPAGG